jgi:hypothetical protein
MELQNVPLDQAQHGPVNISLNLEQYKHSNLLRRFSQQSLWLVGVLK